jgi:hypothetical protein
MPLRCSTLRSRISRAFSVAACLITNHQCSRLSISAWKATHYVCAKRLLASLPTLVTLLQQHGHVCLAEEHRQLLTMICCF